MTISNQTDTFSDSSFFVSFMEGNISAYVGCNQIRGKYSQQGNKLKISVAIMTKMYCRNRAVHEINLINALEGSQQFSLVERELKLEGESITLYLTK